MSRNSPGGTASACTQHSRDNALIHIPIKLFLPLEEESRDDGLLAPNLATSLCAKWRGNLDMLAAMYVAFKSRYLARSDTREGDENAFTRVGKSEGEAFFPLLVRVFAR